MFEVTENYLMNLEITCFKYQELWHLLYVLLFSVLSDLFLRSLQEQIFSYGKELQHSYL